MRRGVETRPAGEAGAGAVGVQEGLGEGAGAAFALCAGYMDDVEAVDVGGLDSVSSIFGPLGGADLGILLPQPRRE